MEMHTFLDSPAFRGACVRAALLHFSLYMEAPTWAAAGGREPSSPGWRASALTGRTEPGLELWIAHTDCTAAELRTAKTAVSCL